MYIPPLPPKKKNTKTKNIDMDPSWKDLHVFKVDIPIKIPMAHHKDIQPHDCQYVDIDPHDKAHQLSIYIYTLKTLVTLVLSQLSYRLGGPPWHNMFNFAQLVTNLQVIQRVDIPIVSPLYPHY